MDLLWAIPPLAAAVAMAIVILGLRAAGGALEGVLAQLEQLAAVRTAVDELRAERQALAAGLDRARR